MDPAWMGVIIVVVVGSALVFYGWLRDRTRSKIQLEELHSPPQRSIPGLPADAPAPVYLSAYEIAASQPSSLELTDGERVSLRERIAQSEPVAVGYDSIEYRTDAVSLWSVMVEPMVLVVDAQLTSLRELLPAVKHAKAAARPLVIVTAGCAPDVQLTLAGNIRSRTFIHLLLICDDAAVIATVCERTQARPVSENDLRSGYVPLGVMGHCSTWVSDAGQSWILN